MITHPIYPWPYDLPFFPPWPPSPPRPSPLRRDSLIFLSLSVLIIDLLVWPRFGRDSLIFPWLPFLLLAPLSDLDSLTWRWPLLGDLSWLPDLVFNYLFSFSSLFRLWVTDLILTRRSDLSIWPWLSVLTFLRWSGLGFSDHNAYLIWYLITDLPLIHC